MNRARFAKSVARRSVLGALGASLAGLLLRPLQAQEAMGPPKRLLIVHRPCGTVLDRFFPSSSDPKSFTLPQITAPFAPLQSELVVLNGVTCPRDTSWLGDAHAAGLITMMCGKKFVPIPGTDASGDPNAKNIVAPDQSIDQYLLDSAPALRADVPSLQSTAYSQSIGGLPSFKVMSYAGNNQPLFPAHDAPALFERLFGERPWPSEEGAAVLDENKSVLDCINADLTRLRELVPASQKFKLESHLSAIRALEAELDGSGTPLGCEPPAQVPLPEAMGGATEDEAWHFALAKNQLSIIQTAFQCDLTRVATFSFAHGNSGLRFQKMLADVDKGDSHHGLSHDTSAQGALARVDQAYSEQLSSFLQQMRAVPEENGTLLDNTLVVYLSECAVGNTHAIESMPVLMLGGKNLGLQTGQHLNFNGRYMNDVWAAVCGAFGLEARFGDPAFSQGPVSGLFG